MANANHVIVNGETIVDLRSDTVSPESMVPGATAHNSAGEKITGTYVPPVTSVNGKTGAVMLGKDDVGLGNVPNVSTNDQTPTYAETTTLAKLTSGEKLSVAIGKIAKAVADLITHLVDTTKHITAKERTAWNGKAAGSHDHMGKTINPAGIELFPGSNAGNGGYIDFHYNNNADDYTSRIIEAPSGYVQLNGSEIMTRANIISAWNVAVTFTKGIAEYSNTAIRGNCVCFAQFRAGMVGSTFQDTALAVHIPANGKLTIVAKNGATFSTHLNILILNF